MKRAMGILSTAGVALAMLASFGRADDEDVYKDWTTKVVLHPAVEPRPSLKYQLLPPFRDRRPGNAVLHYSEAPLDAYTSKERGWDWDRWAQWDEMPLAQLRTEPSIREQKHAWLTESNYFFEQIDRGARCESCDWEIPVRDAPDFNTFLLPELRSRRGLARILSVRARLQIADGKYDAAIRTIQTGYALARHVAQGPTVTQCLVGISIGGVMSRAVEEFIQQPDAPNLYWALATLPRPFIDFRPAWESELDGVFLSYPELRDLDAKSYPPERWNQLLEETVDRILRFARQDNPTRGGNNKESAAAIETERAQILKKAQERYPEAKRFLIASGRSAAEVEAMPAPQVVLLYTMQSYRERRDDLFKCFFLPHPQARKRMEQADRQASDGREIIPFFQTYDRGLLAMGNAQTRINRNLAALQILEALRLYGAAHDGRLPDSLSDITEVPIPLDPFRDAPFLYERTGTDTAVLKSPPAPITPLRYKIRFVREGENR